MSDWVSAARPRLRRRSFVLGLAACAGLSACSTYLPEGATPAAVVTRAEVLARINEVRAANGIGPLSYDLRLEAAARRQAELMASHDEIIHDLGETLRQRVSAAGYDEAVGENLAGGQKTLEAVLAGWIKSPPHRLNLLNSNYNVVGFAVVTRPETKWKIFWATIYGGPTSAFIDGT